MSKEVLHVIPHNDGWAVKREGNERSTSTHTTQKEAIDSARELAREGDDIVVHRQDGTIRERTTYSIGAERSDGSASTNTKAAVKPSDVVSVGTRVSWGAVIAGTVVALGAYLTLSVLVVAIGIPLSDHVHHKTFAIGGAIVMTVALLASLFLGGWVASQITAGETQREAIIYGVLVWGAMLAVLFVGGGTLAVGMSSVLQPLAQFQTTPTAAVEKVQEGMGATTEDQKTNATLLAWWAFGSLVLSLLAAVAGSWGGSGPEWMFRRFAPRTEPAPQTTAAS